MRDRRRRIGRLSARIGSARQPILRDPRACVRFAGENRGGANHRTTQTDGDAVISIGLNEDVISGVCHRMHMARQWCE
jgi:hypothetical protein